MQEMLDEFVAEKGELADNTVLLETDEYEVVLRIKRKNNRGVIYVDGDRLYISDNFYLGTAPNTNKLGVITTNNTRMV